MKNSKLLLLTACSFVFLAACGSKPAPQPQTSAPETTPVQTTEAKHEDESDILSKDEFISVFDMVLEDSENKDGFFVEYNDKTYNYEKLGDLYSEIAKNGGKATVKFLGEEEEEIDFEEYAALAALQKEMKAQPNEGIDIPEEDEETVQLSKEDFVKYFDSMIERLETTKEDFFVEYDGTTYTYNDLYDLYDVAESEGGWIDINVMGNEEEMIDFGIISENIKFMEDWNNDFNDSQISQELIDRFYGDWHGVIQFRNPTGKYDDVLSKEPLTSIARFYIDEDGYVNPFIGVHVEDTPFEDLEAELSAEDECMYLSGSWIGVPFKDVPVVEYDGTLHCEIPIAKDAGSFIMVFNLRHLNDIHWEGIEPALPEDYIVHCQGWTFDQLAEANGYSSFDYVQYSEGEEPEYPVQIEQEEETEVFGKTTAAADGIVSADVLQKGFDAIMDEMDKSGHDPITYERVRDWFGGTDGVKESPAQWNETNHKYEWLTDGEKDWVSISFTVEADGNEILKTVNQSNNILENH